jgi:hypothetical protein
VIIAFSANPPNLFFCADKNGEECKQLCYKHPHIFCNGLKVKLEVQGAKELHEIKRHPGCIAGCSLGLDTKNLKEIIKYASCDQHLVGHIPTFQKLLELEEDK